MANHYDPPSWAGKPPTGLHLDVLKGDRLVQKLMLDQKKCYLFGRNQEMCDFSIDHQSCSRVHAAFVHHKHLNRGFLVDLGSTHGTFIGKLRIDAHKPTFLPVDSQFHFGHSTRVYVLRARPQISNIPILEEFENEDEHADDSVKLENEIALDNITEYNTAQNRRITVAGMDRTDFPRPDLKRKKHSVTFNDEEEIINPEDIDPTVGRFRNLVSTTVIPAKRHKAFADETTNYMLKKDHPAKGAPFPVSYHHDLYYDIPSVHFNDENHSQKVDDAFNSYSSSIVAKLGLPLPNPAPDVDLVENYTPVEDTPMSTKMDILPKKKKYAKEAWPGKKPSTSSMLV